MYSEADIRQIDNKIRKNWLALGPVLAALLGAYIYALAAGIEWLAMVVGPLIFVAACYGVLAYLSPNMGYRRFLQDMQTGLSRDVSGVIVAVSEKEEAQDGARVLPVRIRLDEASLKAQGAPGASVASRRMGLHCARSADRRGSGAGKPRRLILGYCPAPAWCGDFCCHARTGRVGRWQLRACPSVRWPDETLSRSI